MPKYVPWGGVVLLGSLTVSQDSGLISLTLSICLSVDLSKSSPLPGAMQPLFEFLQYHLRSVSMSPILCQPTASQRQRSCH